MNIRNLSFLKVKIFGAAFVGELTCLLGLLSTPSPSTEDLLLNLALSSRFVGGTRYVLVMSAIL